MKGNCTFVAITLILIAASGAAAPVGTPGGAGSTVTPASPTPGPAPDTGAPVPDQDGDDRFRVPPGGDARFRVPPGPDDRFRVPPDNSRARDEVPGEPPPPPIVPTQ
jgi:hypothetical protein